MGVGRLSVYSPISEAREGSKVSIVIKIDNTDPNPFNSELYRLTMHDASRDSPQYCWYYDREGRLCSRSEDPDRCYIWEGVVNAFFDETLTSSFTMPNFDVVLEFGLWRRSGTTWVKDDSARLSVALLRPGFDVIKAALVVAAIGVTGYLMAQIAKLVKR